MDDFEKRARDSAEFILDEHGEILDTITAHEETFVLGVKWAQTEMQAKAYEQANTIQSMYEDNERLKELVERDIGSSAYDALKAKNERLKEELKLTRNVSDQALKNKVSVLQNQIDQLYKTLIRNAEIQAVPRLVMISVREEIDALKAKCDAYERVLKQIANSHIYDIDPNAASEVLAKYKGESK